MAGIKAILLLKCDDVFEVNCLCWRLSRKLLSWPEIMYFCLNYFVFYVIHHPVLWMISHILNVSMLYTSEHLKTWNTFLYACYRNHFDNSLSVTFIYKSSVHCINILTIWKWSFCKFEFRKGLVAVDKTGVAVSRMKCFRLLWFV